MTCGSIYKIQFPNGKHYIGLTTNLLEKRKNEHKYCAKNGDTKCLYNALRKYGMVDTLELIEIDTADTLKELCEKEIGYIIEYNSYYMNKNGYNMTYGGEGTNGYVYTEDDRQKCSKSQKKRFENPEERKKYSETQKKRFENPEEIKKNSEAQKKYYQENPEAKNEMSKKIKKYFENPEAILKNKEAQIIYNQEHPEKGEAHSKKMKQHYENNTEARNHHGEKIKQYYKTNPESREKMSEITKKYYETNPEARRKLSDGKGKNKPFDVFKTDGTFVKTFSYQFEAKEYLQKEYNTTSTFKISYVLAGKRNNSYGFVFKYK
jgi:hypothetical protein